MKNLRLSPSAHPVKATVSVPGSKSYTNRALLLAAMTKGKVKIMDPLASDDTAAMLNCLKSLGIEIASKPGSIEVLGDISMVSYGDYDLDADISGTTMRFMTALCALLPGRQTINGKPGLLKRPIGDLVDGLIQLGADIEYLQEEGYPPLLVKPASPSSGTIKLNGGTSSQYLSALLMVAPLIGDVTIEVTGELSSKPFVNMTVEAMHEFGVKVSQAGNRYHVGRGQTYKCSDYQVEGDVSSASYFFAIAALTGSEITVTNLNPKSVQADMEFLDILESLGTETSYGHNSITAKGSGVRPIKVNMNGCPDQAQTLAVMAAFASGSTKIDGIASLRVKETERIAALEQELDKMGIVTESTTGSLTIRGGQPQAAAIATHGDHRMAMAFAVAGSRLEGMVIEDAEVVSKTFPGFWEQLALTGIRIEEA